MIRRNFFRSALGVLTLGLLGREKATATEPMITDHVPIFRFREGAAEQIKPQQIKNGDLLLTFGQRADGRIVCHFYTSGSDWRPCRNGSPHGESALARTFYEIKDLESFITGGSWHV
jgi:hypothetical protein